MKIPCCRSILQILPLTALLLGPSAYAASVLRVDGKGCPSISDHQRFVDELVNGNVDYTYPSICVDLPTGTTVSDPIESKKDRFGSETTEFILVEVAGKGRYWTIASWVEQASAQTEPAPETESAISETEPATSETEAAAPEAEPAASEAAAAPSDAIEPAPSEEMATAPSETGPEPSATTGTLGPSLAAVNVSTVWFAQELIVHFGQSLPFHGSNFAFDRLASLPADITTFDVSAKMDAATLSVAGSLELSALPIPLAAEGGGEDSSYKVRLQAYVFSPIGRLIWMQEGSPQEDAAVSAKGGSVAFELKRRFRGSLRGHLLLIVAAGEPVLTDEAGTPVILGVKKLML
ncbi:MAG: hypothetical protein Q8P46_09460 [Hyphomicrobiales bacterium]|nr:hypothetical protein [Hyphomicrobiales bacterium]